MPEALLSRVAPLRSLARGAGGMLVLLLSVGERIAGAGLFFATTLPLSTGAADGR